jgi:hypothetical protein
MSTPELDPFLIAHRVGGGEFDMAGKYSPAAVRDQMNRAVAIVERAVRTGLLESGHRLLVIGSGAAAVSAAIAAVKLGIASVTVSQRDEFFDRQRRSARIIDPVEYDWPADGWESGATASTRVPLPYTRGRAKDIVIRQWDPAWTAFREQYEGKSLHIIERGRLDPAARFDRTLDCTGPGEERVDVGLYRWYPFWANDELEYPNLGFETRRPNVLISGGGDGALQDFLRILFPRQTPSLIYQALELSDTDRLRLEWRILNAEDRARRAWVWSADPEIDCGVLSRLHETHRKVAEDLLPTVRTKLERLLEERTTDLDRVWLAHGCNHFSPCYAFNRFLVLLVDEYCRKLRKVGTRMLAGRRLIGVSAGTGVSAGARHTCAGVIEDCLLHPHKPEFGVSLCRKSLGKPAPKASDPFDVIVVRHGLTGVVKRLSRQSLPYELPRLP